MSTQQKLRSTRFGTIEIEDAAVIEFPAGLIGLPGTRWALIAAGADSPFQWLHSLDQEDLALPVTSPWNFFPDYAVELSDADTERVGGEDPDAIEVLVTVRASAELSRFSANLRAPIVIHEGRGFQVINEAADAPMRAPLGLEGDADPAS